MREKKVLAIIPARGGSKRLPGKNILPLQNKPLISWTIEAGLNCEYIDRVIVSSDDKNILKISENYGSEILLRPKQFSTDKASSVSVIKHVINEIDEKFDFFVLLQPTSPLRTENHLNLAFKKLQKLKADAIISVCKVDHSPLWSNTLPKNESMINFLNKEAIGLRSQDLPVHYRLNGAIYICNTKKFIEQKTLYLEKNIYAFIMDRASSVDIDEKIDFKLAESIIRDRAK